MLNAFLWGALFGAGVLMIACNAIPGIDLAVTGDLRKKTRQDSLKRILFGCIFLLFGIAGAFWVDEMTAFSNWVKDTWNWYRSLWPWAYSVFDGTMKANPKSQWMGWGLGALAYLGVIIIPLLPIVIIGLIWGVLTGAIEIPTDAPPPGDGENNNEAKE